MAPSPGETPLLVFLARHGRTALNEAGVLRGLLDPPLDEVGHRQARALGAALAPHRPVRVLSSPLRRARQTAQPTAEATGNEVETDQCWLDRDYGRWAGSPRAEVAERWGSVDDAPGVEPLDDVLRRALEGLERLASSPSGGPILVVSHDALNRAVLAELDAGLGPADDIPQENGCFNRLERRDGRWSVLSVNDVPSLSRSG